MRIFHAYFPEGAFHSRNKAFEICNFSLTFEIELT